MTIEIRSSDNLKQDPSAIEICGENDYYTVLTSHIVKKQMIFLYKEYNPVRVIDKEGVIRLQKVNAQVRTINLGGWKNTVDKLLKESTVFGDGGEEVPNIYIIADSRVIDLSGMQSREQILTLGEAELKSFSGNSDLIIICTLTTQNQRG